MKEEVSLTKSHRDYVEIIGGNSSTYRNYREKRWNQYYFKSLTSAVRHMHKDAERGCILDVGTSTGEWFPFLKKEGFQTIYGVELHERRAEQARAYGYKEVFHCEAQSVPLPDQSIDAAVSNEVFGHCSLKPSA
jgi:ubiquinone/menaquinone biosynthesis C-methylase UbiE